MFYLFAQVIYLHLCCVNMCWTCILFLCFPASHIFKTPYQVKMSLRCMRCVALFYTQSVWATFFKVWHDRLLVSVLNDKITLMHYINISSSLIDTWELFIGFLSVITKCSINRGYGLFFNVYYESVSEGLSVILKNFNLLWSICYSNTPRVLTSVRNLSDTFQCWVE